MRAGSSGVPAASRAPSSSRISVKGACTLTIITPGHALSGNSSTGAPQVLPALLTRICNLSPAAARRRWARSTAGSNGDRRPGPQQAFCNHSAEALRTAGDKRHLAGKIEQITHLAIPYPLKRPCSLTRPYCPMRLPIDPHRPCHAGQRKATAGHLPAHNNPLRRPPRCHAMRRQSALRLRWRQRSF